MIHDMLENQPNDQCRFLEEVQNQTGVPLPAFLRHYRQLVIDVNKRRAYMENPSLWIPHCFAEENHDTATVHQLYLDVVINTTIRRDEIQESVRNSIAVTMQWALERAVIGDIMIEEAGSQISDYLLGVDHAEPNSQSMTRISTPCFPPFTTHDLDAAIARVEQMRDRAITWGVPAPLMDPSNTMECTFNLLRQELGTERFNGTLAASFAWAMQNDRDDHQRHSMISQVMRDRRTRETIDERATQWNIPIRMSQNPFYQVFAILEGTTPMGNLGTQCSIQWTPAEGEISENVPIDDIPIEMDNCTAAFISWVTNEICNIPIQPLFQIPPIAMGSTEDCDNTDNHRENDQRRAYQLWLGKRIEFLMNRAFFRRHPPQRRTFDAWREYQAMCWQCWHGFTGRISGVETPMQTGIGEMIHLQTGIGEMIHHAKWIERRTPGMSGRISFPEKTPEDLNSWDNTRHRWYEEGISNPHHAIPNERRAWVGVDAGDTEHQSETWIGLHRLATQAYADRLDAEITGEDPVITPEEHRNLMDAIGQAVEGGENWIDIDAVDPGEVQHVRSQPEILGDVPVIGDEKETPVKGKIETCPECESSSIQQVGEGNFFCLDCDWDNLQTLAESKGEKMNKWLGFEIKDEWFIRLHVEALTEPFCIWWVDFYGTPDDYSGEGGEGNRHDYYIRMAFALTGWNAKT